MAVARITLRGRSYSIACAPGQEARLETLARRLEARIGKIGEAVGDVGEDRLMLIAALSLLDELDGLREKASDSAAERRAAAAILDAAARIEAIAARAEVPDTD